MRVILLAAVATIGISVSAQAQTMPAAAVSTGASQSPAAAQSPVDAAGDIIVTARRRDESLSKVPISIAVLSGATLEKQGIRSEQDLQTAVPGLLTASKVSDKQD